MQQLFQDAMALIRALGKPDLFITVTCNPQWPEILCELKNVQNADKLTIIARVFKLKLQSILDDIFKKKIFGKVKANMYVIEFQKRGLPDAHILIILDEECKPQNTDDFEHIITAEIPSMVDGKCSCMVDGKCSKDFPKEFCDKSKKMKMVIQNIGANIMVKHFQFQYVTRIHKKCQ